VSDVLFVAACALVDPDGRVLISRRPDDKPMAGQWEFPGGKVEANEAPETALVRELDEELGLDISASCLAPLAFASHRYNEVHVVVLLYVCRRWQGIAMAREGQTLKWERPGDLAKYQMLPADLPLIPTLIDLL